MTATQSDAGRWQRLRTSRALSAAEFLLGAALVIGHNVFHVVPNEVILLVAIALVSFRLRNADLRWDRLPADGSAPKPTPWKNAFAALGFRRPDSWTRIVLIALAAAALRILLGDYVLVPLAERYWPAPETSAVIEDTAGNLGQAALTLLLVWTFAAFGEEIVYRGYLFTRITEMFTGANRENGAPLPSPSPLAPIIALILTSILFGLGHYYKGPTGILDSTFAGLILATAYLLTGRNLWTCVLAHGFIDTVAVVFVYFGLGD